MVFVTTLATLPLLVRVYMYFYKAIALIRMCICKSTVSQTPTDLSEYLCKALVIFLSEWIHEKLPLFLSECTTVKMLCLSVYFLGKVYLCKATILLSGVDLSKATAFLVRVYL